MFILCDFYHNKNNFLKIEGEKITYIYTFTKWAFTGLHITV